MAAIMPTSPACDKAPPVMRIAPLALTLTLGASVLSGCVSKQRYDAALADADGLRAQLGQAQASHADEVNKLRQAIDEAGRAMQERDDRLQEAATGAHNTQAKLDEATAINQQLRGELERLGKNVDKLLSERGTLTGALDDAKIRLEELRKAQAAAEQRAQLFRELVMKFQKMVDAGELQIALRDGRMVLQLPTDVLFDSAKVDIKPSGKGALKQLAQVLETLDDRRFQVAGHTDNVPIQTSRYPSNWELSTARAVEVTRFLVAQGVSPSMLSAAGYGEFDPVAENESSQGRAQNRRIEISLVPSIDELVTLPQLH